MVELGNWSKLKDWEKEYFLERYLENKSLPANPDFEKHYLDLIHEQDPSR